MIRSAPLPGGATSTVAVGPLRPSSGPGAVLAGTAVRLTSKPHDGDRDFLALGTGEWDAQGRPSWIDIEQLYSVHHDGMRREASALDLNRFVRVADALHRRYGWDVGN